VYYDIIRRPMPKSKFAFLYTAVDSYHLMLNPEIEHIRKPAYKINPLFLNRWSPRSMPGQGSVIFYYQSSYGTYDELSG
jgi:hypothetical protein